MITLSPENEFYLKSIKAPVTVAVPPDDATRGMCQMPDGEIRVYGTAAMPNGAPMTFSSQFMKSRDLKGANSAMMKVVTLLSISFFVISYELNVDYLYILNNISDAINKT